MRPYVNGGSHEQSSGFPMSLECGEEPLFETALLDRLPDPVPNGGPLGHFRTGEAARSALVPFLHEGESTPRFTLMKHRNVP